jgi:hypothetical protein
MLAVNPAFVPGGLNVFWSLAPGSRSYLTVVSGSPPNERGMAYNPLTRRVILVSRTSPTVYVLDGDTGADLWTLNKTGVTGGYTSAYYLLMVGVADDGAVYAGNLTVYGTTTNFKLYRWANDSSGTMPTVAYSGDPGAGTNQRWGDTLDVRGAGTNTQVIIGSRSGNVAAVLTTANGTSFTSRLITVADAPMGAFGLGIAFGAGNTFWGKATSQNLRQVSFDPAAGSGTTVRSYADPTFPATVAPIGVTTDLNLLGGINLATAGNGNHFRLYDLAPTLTNGTPVLITSTNFATDNENTYSGTGAVDFGGDRVYALSSNNGLLAMQIIPLLVNTPPTITLQPQPATQSVTAGQSATFTVTATGSPSPNYQWCFNATSILGATASSYTRNNAQPADAGSYSVVVTNVAGSVTSSNAILIVNVPPAITTQPQPGTQSVTVGQSASFTVSATGTAPLSYQWRFNGTNLVGATTPGYTRTNAHPADAGSYSVVVTNVAGSVTSSNAILIVNVPPEITTQPASLSVTVGANAAFSVTATGTAPLAYQWYFGGLPIAGATDSAFTVTNAQPAAAGDYAVEVINVAGQVTSSNAVLTVTQPTPPQIDRVGLLPDGQIRLQVSGAPGQYAVEATTNLVVVEWVELTNFTATTMPFQYVDSETNLAQRFYRVRLMP